MLRTSYAMCVLSILLGLFSAGKANAQKTWSPEAVLTTDDGYPFFTGDTSDSGWTYVETSSNGYTGAAQISRSANSTATGQTIYANQASYQVTWTLTGSGATPTLTVTNRATASATLIAGVSSGEDIANIGISNVVSTSASTLGLAVGATDPHSATPKQEDVTMDGQVTSRSKVHPAAAVSKKGNSFYATGTFSWIAAIGPAGGGN